MMASPSAPLCDMKAMRPRAGGVGAKVALSWTAGAEFTIPMQLGPMRRMPYARQIRTSVLCRSTPAPPVSANPALTTTSARTPLRPHASAASSTASAGTAITARSTGPGTSSTPGYASTLCTTREPGLTGNTGPANW
jgi:hypothetical protein